MREIADESIHSIVTDPPYGLSFMGKEWDHGIPGKVFWIEALRVAKPGAHLLAFGGTRTYHRLACAIEDAGWEIRDCVMWVYGSGFPKSLDVSKAIDKAAGAERTEVVGTRRRNVKPYDDTNGWNQNNTTGDHNYTAPATDAAKQWDGWGTALKPAWEPIIVARKPLDGTVAENVVAHGTGAINVDGCRVEYQNDADKTESQTKNQYKQRDKDEGSMFIGIKNQGNYTPSGRWPANLIHDGSDEVVGLFPSPHGAGAKREAGQVKHGNHSSMFGINGHDSNGMRYGDTGSAARFFYCAKASKVDRGADNLHPTVKPTALMRYLCRLVTPPGGIVLDPFMGSGSTGKAAVMEGFNFIGIEQNKEYFEISKARIKKAKEEKQEQFL